MTGYAGQVVMADNLPAIVTAPPPASTNTITATSWAVLPGGSLTASITNPSGTKDMVVMITMAAKISASASDVRVCVGLSGGMTVAAGAVEPSWGNRLWSGSSGLIASSSSFPIVIPAGASAVTVTMYAYRASATGTQQCDYPTLILTPLRFQSP
jgi:hypothetical protein